MKKVAFCENEISEYDRELRQLKKTYIEEHKPYEVGQKVSFVMRKQTYYGIVESLNEVGGDVFPRIHKIKKDGTMSKHRFYIPWESMSTMKVLN